MAMTSPTLTSGLFSLGVNVDVVQGNLLRREHFDRSRINPCLVTVGSTSSMPCLVYISRSVDISSAHRLHAHDLSNDENARVYGKCNHIHGHGHNYKIIVTLRGPTDKYGMVMNLTDLKTIMEKVIVQRMDHKFIDKDVDYFKTRPSTAENIAIYIWDELKQEITGDLLYEVRIEETGKNVAFYRGET